MIAARRGVIGLLYTLPALAFVAAFVLYPILDLIRMSLTNASLLGGGEFVGLKNYVKAVGDATFWHSLAFTSEYTLFITPILIGAGFLLALLVVEPSRIASSRAPWCSCL